MARRRASCTVRVAFLGNHTVGVTALQALRDVADVVAVVAHPVDPEDGVRYASVYEYATAQGLPVQRGRATDPGIDAFLRAATPDLLWVTDYRYLLPAALLALPRYGAINLHPSLLPAYRGRAPLNWAILRGEREVGLTAHMIDAGMDSGDIVAQHRLAVAADDDVGTVLARLMPLYDQLPRELIGQLERGTISRRPQAHALATTFPRRTPDDGRIDWAESSETVHNLVRAVAAPYPGAFTTRAGAHVTVWRTRPVETTDAAAPGAVVALRDGRPVVACGDGAVVLLAADGEVGAWHVGERLV
jgi:methionyl-tRNA formyltransferase